MANFREFKTHIKNTIFNEHPVQPEEEGEKSFELRGELAGDLRLIRDGEVFFLNPELNRTSYGAVILFLFYISMEVELPYVGLLALCAPVGRYVIIIS